MGPPPQNAQAWLALGAALLLAACGGEVGGTTTPAPSLTIRVTDAGAPIPARVVLFAGGQTVRFGTLDFLDGTRQARGYCWLAPGALGTWDGLVLPWGEATIPASASCGAELALPPGTYRVWAWQGVEYERWQGEVTIGAAPVTLEIPLVRAFTPDGALAADLHVHAAASPDSTVPTVIRALTLAAAGVRVVALSDHNVNGDLDDELRWAELTPRLASIASNELSSDWAHIGVYPVVIDRAAERGGSPPEAETAPWSGPQILAHARGLPGRPIVQVNHPRYRVYALFDLAGWDGVAWPPPFPLDFDAVEVLSGNTAYNAPGDRRIDESVRDFYTLIDHGALVTAVGNSDTHYLTGIRDALTRTYVFVDDPVTDPFDEAEFIAAIRARRAVATTGPWLDVEVVGNGGPAGPGQAISATGGSVHLDVEVKQAAWSRADKLRIWTGDGTGARIAFEVPVGASPFRWTLDLGLARDGWIGVDVGGDTLLPVEMTGDVEAIHQHPGATPFALINPILVDADGDGFVRYQGANVTVTAP